MMLQHSQKFVVAVIMLLVYTMALVGDGLAEELGIKLVVNPSKTDVSLGSEPIALTARVKGKNLVYDWKLLGPGKLEGKGSSVFYILPEKIDGDSEQALITVTVKDETGEETTESVTFNILAKAKATGKGMSTTTKIALGVGAAAALGGGIALAAGGGDDDGDGGDATYYVVDVWRYCRGSGETWGCGNIVFDGTSTSGTYTRTDENKHVTYYGTYSVDGSRISMTDGDDSTASPEKWDGTFISEDLMRGTWYVIANPAISHDWEATRITE